MSLSDAVIGTVVFTRGRTLGLVADLSDEQLVAQPAGPGGAKTNHGAWVRGHLITTDYALLGILTGQAVPAWIDEPYKAKYGNKSVPVAGRENYQKKEWYVERLKASFDQIIAKLKTMKDADFDVP